MLTMKKFWINGKHLSISEIVKLPECEVSKHTIYYRLDKGESIHEAIKIKREKFFYMGRLRTLSELARLPECAVPYNILRQRLKNGWDLQRAITEPRRQFNVSIIIEEEKNDPQKEKNKEIFKVPVNPMKCRYTRGFWR